LAGSPRIIARPTTRSPAACRRARGRQGQAFGGAEEATSLTAAARDGDGNMRSGRKNARGAGRTKEWNAKDDQNGVTPLDKESPIQAVCPNWARTDLCGGREVTRVPTAKAAGTRSKRLRTPTGRCVPQGRNRGILRQTRWDGSMKRRTLKWHLLLALSVLVSCDCTRI